MDDRGQNEGPDVSGDKIEKETESRKLIYDLLQAEKKNGILSQKKTEQSNDRVEDEVSFSLVGDGLVGREARHKGNDQRGQKILLKILYNQLA